MQLPGPADDFEQATSKAITYLDLTVPTEQDLRQSFNALLDIVVARDSKVTRAEQQLDQLCNLLLLKLESDTFASLDSKLPAKFQLMATEAETATHIRGEFTALVHQRMEVFGDEANPQLLLDDHTIKEVVFAWSGWNMLEVGPEAVSSAFQVFRRKNLKAGEGQYFTPERVIGAAVKLLDVQPTDKIIDPACGTGGFLIEAFRSLSARIQRPESVRTWAHRNVFGVDKDSINIKLARAMMMVLGDGSANVHIGDSIREDRWKSDYPALSNSLKDGTFTVVLTNPPFGENLKVSAKDCRTNGYTISHAAGGGTYKDIEIGLVFLERAHRLLSPGGRLAIILPETYFFSPSYAYIRGWLADRFIMRGVVSIPMEAFQGFCRAKTNLYVLEKVTPTAASAVEEDLARNTVAKPARTRRLKNPRPASAGHAATQTGSGAA